MSRHVTYRGTTIDMETLARENEHVLAVGNHPVNAKGDQVKNGVVIKSAADIARENHLVQSIAVNTGLKGAAPVVPGVVLDSPQPTNKSVSKSLKPDKAKDTELPNGDIIAGDADAS